MQAAARPLDRALFARRAGLDRCQLPHCRHQPSRKLPCAESRNMINHHSRTPVKIQDARVLAEVICAVSCGQENDLVVQAAKVLELHHLNLQLGSMSAILQKIDGNTARIADALDRFVPK